MKDAARITALQDAFWRAAEGLLYHHSNPWELDEALSGWDYGMGPCEAQDLLGLQKVLARAPVRPTPVLARMVAEGRLGKLGGVGFYRYPGGGGAVIDPLIEDLILEEAWFGKVARVELTDAELVARMNASLGPLCQSWLDAGMAEEALRGCLGRAVHFPRDRALPAVIQRTR